MSSAFDVGTVPPRRTTTVSSEEVLPRELRRMQGQCDRARATIAVRRLIRFCGENPLREDLHATTDQMLTDLLSLTSGYSVDLVTLLNGALFDVQCDEPVSVKGIEFISLCEQHMLPFFGTADVTYVPTGRVIGLSKLPRIVDMFSRRLQRQERLTGDIARAVHVATQARSIAVTLRASHVALMLGGLDLQRPSSIVTRVRLGACEHESLVP